MQKVCATFLLIALVANYEALPQTKWSRPISNGQGQLTRERRQFAFGDWIPVNKPCSTCRPLIDPLEVAQRTTDIGLTPPRPPTVTRQVHAEGNFFPRDESSILSVPPPPPGTLRHGSNGNFQSFRFQGFPQQFNTHVPLPTQQVFPPSQHIQFLQQPFVANQNVLLNSNQQPVSVLNNQNSLSGQENQGKQVLNSAKVPSFNAEFKKQNIGENIVLQQNQSGRKLPFSGGQASFGTSQQQLRQQTFVQQPQQQSFVQHHQQQAFAQQHQQPAFAQQSQQQALIQQRPLQQQQSLNYDSILTPPPVANATASGNVVIPGLDKEEVQLLYVPVETLKHRGTLQHQHQQQNVLTQQPQSFQFPNRQISQQRQPTINAHSSDGTITATSTAKLLPGSFVASQRETLSTVKVSSPQPFSTASTPTTVFFQSLPLQQTPQPFVSATPIISTPSPFVTQSSFVTKSPSFTQTFSTLSPTTLSHFPTFQNSVQFKQYENQFVTTPKTLISEDGLREEIITGKPQFESVQMQKLPFTQDQSHVILTSEQQSDKNPTTTTAQIQTTSAEQFQNQQLLLKSQQEQQLLLQQQKEKELKEEYLLKQRHQKELESQRLRDLQRLKELEHQAFLLKQKKQKELEEQKIREEEERQRKIELEEKRQKELEEERLLQQRQRELEQERYLQQQRQKELEEKQLEEERQRKIELEEKRQKELEEERLLQQRQKELEQERHLQEQRQKELERERFLQQQRQKELEQERYLQQQRQKELERERYLKQQKEKEIEQERYLQEQRQKEMEKQLKINRLKELDERRLLQQRQKEQEEQRLHFLQQQKEFEEQQQRLRQQQEQQEQLLQQNLQRQKQESAQKAQTNQYTQQKELNKHAHEEQSNRHVFSETDDSNFISQAEKEVDPESLIPHQPPLSVFFRGDGESQPKIVDVLRELRSSQTIIVLDQYFEKMPKVFVGPAGLKPPLGYGKFELPYLSNIDNPIEVKIDKLPFFVAPLNFVPPPGYSKIPFPSPHVGSVVVSSELNPAMTLKATEDSLTVENNDDAKNYAAVGPELPGLINGLQKDVTTTVKPTTPSLPQTTAQLRNRRPSNSLYRSRTKARSTTTPRPEETQKPQREESEGGFKRPFNRFLKRRRPTTTSTTTTTETPQEKNVESKQYSFQVPHRKRTRLQPNKPVIGQKPNHQQDNQGFEKTSPGGQSHVNFKYNSDIYKIQSNDEKFNKQSHRLPEYSDINNIQTFEDGPIPTGSAKSITQEVYRPNDLKITNINRQSETQTKLQPKVDATHNSQKIFEVPKLTSFVEDSEVNPTALYVETTAGKISTPDHFMLTPKSESISNGIPTTLPPSFYKSETYVSEPSSAPFVQQLSTTENALQDDRFTVAFAEISKHYHIPGPQETSRKYETKYTNVKPTPEISHALQPPLIVESLSQEQQPQGLVTLEEVKPTYSITDSENINSPVTTSNEGFPEHFENENKYSQNFNGTVNEVRPTASGSFYSKQHNTDYTTKSQSTLSFVAETEQPIASFGNTEKVYSTPLYPTSTPEQYYFTSLRVPIQDYITSNNKSKAEENYYPATFETIRVSPEIAPTTPNYGQEIVSHNDNDNLQKFEDISQTSRNVPSTTQGLKFSNPSIVKVRTRVRGRQRGSVNFASSQSSTSAPALRTKYKNQFDESDQEYASKANGLRNYNPVKTSKYTGFRGLKKPVVSSTPYAQTVELTTEYDQKANVYTIRPQRRPSNPSTVSTKRIRRPTSPFPTLESSTEGFGISTSAVYSQGGIETQEYPSSGVSNDVYYEHGNISPIRQKLIKTQGLYEQAALKTVPLPSYTSTTPSPLPTLEANFPPTFHESYSQNGDYIQEAEPSPQPSSEKYPEESNLSESGLDVSGIILTTLRSTIEEESSETEIPKKFQESKKAVDPDLEKKNGRRRIRVRVNKRPHENFETAESQNLRTVANVLVPPTSTYKPIDESGFHQLSKNSHSSYGLRSREYFKKKLNLTHLTEIDVAKSREDSIEDKNAKRNENSSGEVHGDGGIFEEHRLRGYFGKTQRKENEFGGDQATENVPSGPAGEKFSRTKVRGFVRKIKKHGIPTRNITTSTVSNDDDDGELKQENVESHSRQHLKVNYGGSHQNGRFNGTRHRTIIKYVKKNRFRTHENEPSEQEAEKGEKEHKVTESHSSLIEEEQRHETDIHTTQQTEPQNNEEEFRTTLKNDEADEIFTTLRTEALRTQEMESETTKSSAPEQSNVSESLDNQQQTTENTEDSSVHSTEEYGHLHTQRSDMIQPKIQTTEQSQQFDTDTTEAFYIPTTENVEVEKASASEESSSTNEESLEKETESNSSTSSTQKTELKFANKPKPFHSFRPLFQRTPSSGFIRTREPLSSSTTEHFKPESNERRFGLNRQKYEKISSRKEEKSEEKKIVEHADRLDTVKSSFTPEIRKYSRNKNRDSSFSSFSKSRYTTPSKLEITSETSQNQENDFSEGQPQTTFSEFEKTTKELHPSQPELDVSTKVEHSSNEDGTTQTFIASTEPFETTNEEHTTALDVTTTARSIDAETSREEEAGKGNEKEIVLEELLFSTEGKTELPTTSIQTITSEEKVISTESATEAPTSTEKGEISFGTQPNLYVFGRDTFSFDEAEKFTGTKNRAHVRNITADILENTAHFSAPGIDKQNEVQSDSVSRETTTTIDINNIIGGNEKTEEGATTELTSVETTTTTPPSTKEAVVSEAVTKPKIAKLVKTSTTTKISHETEICYRGKCIRTKSENPDEDLKLLVDSANISLEKNKT